MNREVVDKLVNAVLYEGYILYPYRASSKKNQRERFTFGRVYPRNYSEAQDGREPCLMQTECLIQNESRDALLEISVRFLQPSSREIGKICNSDNRGSPAKFDVVPELLIDDQLYQSWQEAIEREVKLPSIPLNMPMKQREEFHFDSASVVEPIGDGTAGIMIRRNESLRGQIELETRMLDQCVLKVGVRITNETPVAEDYLRDQNEVIMRTFASTHTILHTAGGKFISLLDPPPQYIEPAKSCRNIGTWPVLVGDAQKNERDVMLSSPIILYDYPQIAPESAGALFDSTEIDEILTLRVKTLTDAEKIEMRQVDEQARRILERTESMSPEHFMKMHGILRNVQQSNEDFFNPKSATKNAVVAGVELKTGDRVRIRPKRRADVMDMALAGKVAIIEAIEEDVENNIHFALVLEDDPGRELGLSRYIGHRFFYSADEVEPITEMTKHE